MMAFTIEIRQKGLLPRSSLSSIRRLKKAAMGIVAVRWHDTYSQFKFTPAAAAKYHYTERKTKHVRTGKIKRDKRGRPRAPSGNPLEWTGRSRALAHRRRVKANSKRSSVTSPIRAFNFRSEKANAGLNMMREYKQVLPAEERVLAKAAERFMRRQFKSGKRNIQVSIS